MEPDPTILTMLSRRRALALFAGAGAVALVGCGADNDDTAAATTSSTGGSSSSTASTATTATSSSTDCTEIPDETSGPYPGDGTNGPDVLAQDGVVRRDITSSFGSASGVAEGVPLTIELTVVDADTCAPIEGAAVYAWHCDREGRYSMYSSGAENENYLRGVQVSGSDGTLGFRSIFPAAYSGRWPHVHFEVYGSVDEATGGGSPIKTSQLALPQDICETVYATDGYDDSVGNLAQTSLTSDNVFGDDGAAHQLADVSGSVADGYTARLTVGV